MDNFKNSANISPVDELSQWKGRALFLEQSVKRLVQENRELRHELGRTKNQVMQCQKDCEEARRQRDREVNKKRTIQQFEEEERRARAIASAAFADPVPLTADERGHAELMKRISPMPMRRIMVSATQNQQRAEAAARATAAAYDRTGTATAAPAPQFVQQQPKGRTFPTVLSVFGECVPSNCRRVGAMPSKNIVGVRFTQQTNSAANASQLKRTFPGK
ncbi:hypothetical protein niasHT_020969 [Heterodera trifolii]|uniref:Uncharacterized protein n=1 Tax=Heterodera trifolii TaxID=157864 RepID=A0ABD2KDG6_9BILA